MQHHDSSFDYDPPCDVCGTDPASCDCYAEIPGRHNHGMFCTWSYKVPSKTPRGFWHGETPILDGEQWAYALRSKCGTFFRISSALSGFKTESAAIDHAKTVLKFRKTTSAR